MKRIKVFLTTGLASLLVLGIGIPYNQHLKNVNAKRNDVTKSYNVPQRTLRNVMKTSHMHYESREQKYRIYSHHYLTIEHHDLEGLRNVWNRYAKHTNYLSENQYATNGGIVYHKFNDGNYWSVYHDVRVPSNFKHSHLNNRTYYLINKRVLKAHGVFSGINFSHSKLNNNIDDMAK